MSYAGNWNSSRRVDFATQFFAQVSRIMERIIEADLLQAAESLFLLMFVKGQSQPGLGINAAKAGAAFQVQCDVGKERVAVADSDQHISAHRYSPILPFLIPKNLHFVVGDLDDQMR